jgi:hypothetical protein
MRGWVGTAVIALDLEYKDKWTFFPTVVDMVYSKDVQRMCWLNAMFLELFSLILILHNKTNHIYRMSRQIKLNI